MKELRHRRMELERTFDEFQSVWMLQRLKKMRMIESFEIQALRNVVKENGPDVVANFEKKFKEIKVEGKRNPIFLLQCTQSLYQLLTTQRLNKRR